MTTQKSKETYSRHKARKIAKQLIPDLKRHEIIHHVDLDPFHNEMYNFAIMTQSEHSKLHWALHPEKMGNTKSISQDLEELESWLTFYNNNYAL